MPFSFLPASKSAHPFPVANIHSISQYIYLYYVKYNYISYQSLTQVFAVFKSQILHHCNKYAKGFSTFTNCVIPFYFSPLLEWFKWHRSHGLSNTLRMGPPAHCRHYHQKAHAQIFSVSPHTASTAGWPGLFRQWHLPVSQWLHPFSLSQNFKGVQPARHLYRSFYRHLEYLFKAGTNAQPRCGGLPQSRYYLPAGFI